MWIVPAHWSRELPLPDVQQQPITSILHQIQHQVEPSGTTVLRIRHHSAFQFQAELRESFDLALLLRRAALLRQSQSQSQIVPVHGQDQIKLGEVACLDLAGPQVGQVVAPLGGMLL